MRAAAEAAQLPLVDFGGYALNRLRIEKGFYTRADFDFCHYTECAAAVAKKRDFQGKCAGVGTGTGTGTCTEGGSVYQRTREAALFRVGTEPGWEWSVPPDTPIFSRRRGAADRPVGLVTSSAPGATTGKTLAMGFWLVQDGSGLGTGGAEGEHEGELALFLRAYGKEWAVERLSRPPL